MEADALMDMVADALRAHGYDCTLKAALEGRSGTVYTVPLLAEREGSAVVFDVHEGDVPEDLPSGILDVREDVAAEHAVLCHTGSDPAPIAGIRFWGPRDLSKLFGDALLAEATGIPAELPVVAAPDTLAPAPAPVAESVEQLLPTAFSEPEPSLDLDLFESMELGDAASDAAEWNPDMDTEGFAGFGDLGDASTDLEQEHAPEVGANQAAPLAPALAETSTPTATSTSATQRFTYPLLPVLVTHAEAREQARERLYNVTHVEMILQPVHLLDYECDLMGKGTLRYDTVRGRVQVHGTDKSVQEVDAQAVDPAGFSRLADASGFEGAERTLRTSEQRADAEARHHLTEAHTRTVDVQVDDETYNVSYTEKTKVRPRPDHIRLQHLGVFHRVVWRVHGPNGHVDVDAVTGADVGALQTPDPDVVVID